MDRRPFSDLIDTDAMAIRDLLRAEQQFVVPRYQRDYSWEDEVSEFLADISALFTLRLQRQEASHFFGGIMTTTNHRIDRKVDVVDGQQRLATFCLLLAVIAQEFGKLEEEAGKEGFDDEKRDAGRHTGKIWDYLEFDTGRRYADALVKKLVLSQADKDYFDELLESTRGGSVSLSHRASHRRLVKALSRIRKDVRTISRKRGTPIAQRVNLLYEYMCSVLDDCYIILVQAGSQSDAYEIFEGLNDRGRDLTAGNLLRATTLGALEDHPLNQERAAALWDQVLSSEPGQTEKFLRAYYTAINGRRPGKRTLFPDFRKRFFPATHSSHQVVKELAEIKVSGDKFNSLVEGIWPFTPSAVKSWDSERLMYLTTVLKHDLSYPLLLAAAESLEQGVFAQLVFLLEKVFFRHKIVLKSPVQELTKLYYEECLIVRLPDYSLAPLQSKLSALLGTRTDDEFRAALVREMVYREGNAQANQRLKYFLGTLDDHWGWCTAGTPIHKSSNYDFTRLQIEHIYPQNPKVTDSSMEPLKHRLGNLTIWSDENPIASRDMFLDKRHLYENSKLQMNKELADLSHWDSAALVDRERQLLDHAVSIYRI